jgi:hypothetical protein
MSGSELPTVAATPHHFVEESAVAPVKAHPLSMQQFVDTLFTAVSRGQHEAIVVLPSTIGENKTYFKGDLDLDPRNFVYRVDTFCDFTLKNKRGEVVRVHLDLQSGTSSEMKAIKCG